MDDNEKFHIVGEAPSMLIVERTVDDYGFVIKNSAGDSVVVADNNLVELGEMLLQMGIMRLNS